MPNGIKVPTQPDGILAGSAVNITGYTQNNPYITPCDGYFQLYSRTSGRFLYGAISLDGGTVNVTYFGATNGNGTSYNSVYVPKGASIYMLSTDDAGGYGTFFPILNRP